MDLSTVLNCIPIFFTETIVGYVFFILLTLSIVINLMRL